MLGTNGLGGKSTPCFYLEASRAVMLTDLHGPLCMITKHQSGGMFHLLGKRSTPHMHIATKPQVNFSTSGGQQKPFDEDDELSAEMVEVSSLGWMDGWMDGSRCPGTCRHFGNKNNDVRRHRHSVLDDKKGSRDNVKSVQRIEQRMESNTTPQCRTFERGGRARMREIGGEDLFTTVFDTGKIYLTAATQSWPDFSQASLRVFTSTPTYQVNFELPFALIKMD